MEIILGEGYSKYYHYVSSDDAYMAAFHDAHNFIEQKYGESYFSDNIKWLKENFPNQYLFQDQEFHIEFDENGERFTDGPTTVCRISIELLSDEAVMAYKLRWL